MIARRRLARVAIVAVLVAAAVVARPHRAAAAGTSPPARPTASPPSAGTRPPAEPMFAYFYQWFDPSSWNRAKIDYPAIGRYSSDDRAVLRQQIRQAQAAGIQGFIVSWKDSVTNTRRLHELVAVAAEQHFLLSMIYQGLDFNRKPLPAARVAADFRTFRAQFATSPVFYRVGGKVLTIFSGTWEYSHADVAAITSDVRAGLLVLSTEKSVAGYRRIADVTDGDAYYWSSVNPQTNPTYVNKLIAMSQAVHADGKFWVAPLAPGFDARLVGGAKAVPRDDGATLRTEYNAAVRSSPDLLGLISWNEFSENTYVEPSQRFGRLYLDVLTDLRHVTAPTPQSAADSSTALPAAAPRTGSQLLWYLVLGPLLAVLALAGIGLALRRRRRSGPSTGPERGGAPPADHPATGLSRSGR